MFNKSIISMLFFLSSVVCAQTEEITSNLSTELTTHYPSNLPVKDSNFLQKEKIDEDKISESFIENKYSSSDDTTNFISTSPSPIQFVAVTALGDSLTTYIGLSGGAIEVNPLINTSPIGLITLFAVKLGITSYINQQPEPQRSSGLKKLAGAWGGVSINNLLVIAGASTPVSLIGGVIAGIGAYYYQEKLLKEEKQKNITKIKTEQN